MPKSVHVLLVPAKILKTSRKICFCLLMISTCPKLSPMLPPQLESRESVSLNSFMSKRRKRQPWQPAKEPEVESKDRDTAVHRARETQSLEAEWIRL